MGLLEIVAVVSSAAIIVAVAALIKKGRLMEKYAILWLAASAVLLVFSLWRPLLDTVAHALGFYYPPALLFLAGFVFLMLILMHFSVVISSLSRHKKALAQEIGLLKLEVEKLREELAGKGR